MATLIKKILALLILVLSSPLFLLIAVFIMIDSRGPAIFKQKRMGKDKKNFTLYKFRTMISGAEKLQDTYRNLNESDGPTFKIANDPRFTRFGRLLSKSGLDELPQLINIIRGDMDFVGPRPLPIKEAVRVPERYQLRFSVLPGITSSWVIKGAHGLKFKKWMELDLKDIKNKSLTHDLKIIASTTRILLQVRSKTLQKLLNK